MSRKRRKKFTELGRDRYDYTAKEAIEPLLTVGSSLAAAAPSGIGGIVGGLLDYARGGEDPVNTAVGIIDDVSENLTYMPRTDKGRENLMNGLNLVGDSALMKGIDAAQNYIPDKIIEAGGPPWAATTAYVLPDVVGALTGAPGVMSRGRKFSQAMDRVSPNMAPRSPAGVTAREAGSIGGVKAKGVNPEMIAAANKLKAEGASPLDIWFDTGSDYGQPAWFDRDGNLKWEFSDENAKLQQRTFKQDVADLPASASPYEKEYLASHKYGLPQPGQEAEFNYLKKKNGLLDNYETLEAELSHPELAKNYPEAMKMGYEEPMRIQSGASGDYNPRDNRMRIVRGKAQDDNFKRSVMLHEAGAHAAQTAEGHPRGGGVAEFAREKAAAEIQVTAINKRLDLILDAMDKENTVENSALLRSKYQELLGEKGMHIEAFSQDPTDSYLRLVGEGDARAVQARRDLTMQERLNRPFWMDYDKYSGFPDNQIYRYD